MNLALFDLDETIVANDTSYEWIDWLITHNIAEKSLQEKNKQLMEEYYTGKVDIRQQIELSLQPVRGTNKKIVDLLVNTFIEQVVVKHIFPAAIERINWHREQGDYLVMISASSNHLVEPIGRYLKFDKAFGIEAEQVLFHNPFSQQEEQVYNGETTGIPTFQAGKVSCIEHWLKTVPEIKNKIEQIYAYSDSMNDLFLLDFADQAFVINPNSELKALAQSKNWQICEW